MGELHFDTAGVDRQSTYHLLNSLVVPRPIAWVSTLSDQGVTNVAPHSFYNVLSSDPPTVYFSSSGLKDSVRNAQFTGDYVVNVVDEFLAEQMNLSSADFPATESEYEAAGLSAIASDMVKAPRMAEACASLECKVTQILEIGNAPSFVVIGEVVRIHVAERIWRNGRVDHDLMRPLGRLAGSGYSYTREFLRMERPTYAGLVEAGVIKREDG